MLVHVAAQIRNQGRRFFCAVRFLPLRQSTFLQKHNVAHLHHLLKTSILPSFASFSPRLTLSTTRSLRKYTTHPDDSHKDLYPRRLTCARFACMRRSRV